LRVVGSDRFPRRQPGHCKSTYHSKVILEALDPIAAHDEPHLDTSKPPPERELSVSIVDDRTCLRFLVPEIRRRGIEG
jgi:hypothetical protein